MLANKLTQCTVCDESDLHTTIDLGQHSPANWFVDSPESQEVYPLAFGYCKSCGTAQLTKRIPFEAIRPRFNWLVYNEPEGHLDDASVVLSQLPGIDSQSHILGVTYKDQSTIDRLSRLGIKDGCYVAEKDFERESGSELFGLETIQSLLRNSAIIDSIKDKYEQADILLMRHIIEHSDNAAELVFSLKPLVKDGGYLVMELPDSEKIIDAKNYPFIWEEHVSYFTEKTIHGLAANVGASVAWFKRYKYPYEDSLMVAFQFSDSAIDKGQIESVDEVDRRLATFGESFEAAKTAWRKQLQEYKDRGEKVAVFGAGHLSAKFINFYQLNDLIECVIDDNPHKVNMNMPGSMLPILPSSELAARGINICISTLSPESEAKVRQKFKAYFDNGGIFLPAFSVVE